MLKHSLVRKIRNRTIKQGTSLVQAARFLGVDQSTLYVALQKGQIPSTTRNGRIVISQGALMDYQARIRPLL
ncbi:helix-turn-helix domain-containing protein [Nostoc spongiaeforme FACHB-130]|uniref:Helix-turn-helix domain-containing protein n=1 Tax=Nostoc spongiaeforme FACHB-130 TaxID=1357510 RepID=A0ABR8FNV4_9NOSO|nr:helix-turn-helix domain-containing protein [Nostoc spongiaeforme]MBD2592817.1 helix-turn-helix domain-containing protein [Nostoc spongiaeforme FACHB-130]